MSGHGRVGNGAPYSLAAMPCQTVDGSRTTQTARPLALSAVLLDLDGTLVASRDGIVRCLRQALLDLGHELDPERDLTWAVGP